MTLQRTHGSGDHPNCLLIVLRDSLPRPNRVCIVVMSQVDRTLVYSICRARWKLPCDMEKILTAPGALGCWDGRVFVFTEDGGWSLSLWELEDGSLQTWCSFARIPSELHAWLVPTCFQPGNSVRVFASFPEEHVLIYTLTCEKVGEQEMTKRFVQFNLRTKQWQEEEISAVRAYSEDKNGQWDSSVDQFTEDRQGIRSIYPWL